MSISNEFVYSEIYRGLKIGILPDECPIYPRDIEYFTNLGHLVGFHSRYDLCDDDHKSMTIKQLQKIVNKKDVVAIPLYLYEHSGITISTTPFACPWDSGQIGWIYITYPEIHKHFSRKRVSKKLLTLVEKILRDEVQEYDNYLRGNIYGYYIIGPEGEEDTLDSCYGFSGDYEHAEYGALNEARRGVDEIVGKTEPLVTTTT